jgi:cytochrome c
MSAPARIILSIALTASTVLLATLAVAAESEEGLRRDGAGGSGGGLRLDGAAKGDTAAGRAAFDKRCTGCHALDREKVGPRLAGIVGRKAGAISTYPYSDAVKKSGLVWNEVVLDKWLTDPETVIPDTDMTFRLTNPGERAAIISFLKETGKQ